MQRENKKRDWQIYKNAVERGGVAVMMSNNMYKHLEYIEPAGSIMMRIRFKFHKKMDIIIVYGQQAIQSHQEKDKFYEQLRKMIEDTPDKHANCSNNDMFVCSQQNTFLFV